MVRSSTSRTIGYVRSTVAHKTSVFEIFRDKDGDHHFRLKTAKGEIILTSEAYATHAETEEGIEVVRKLAPEAMNYERKQTTTGLCFNLQTYSGEVIGTSAMFASSSALDKAIKTVKREAPEAEVVDVK